MKKKIALVTGASGGIGSACARELAARGYTVLAHANRNLAAAQQLADELCAKGMDTHAMCCDLSDSRAVQTMCDEILKLYHHVDALVLCAGVSHTGLMTDMTDEQWHRVMDINVSGSFYLIRALAPGMVSQRSGSIVTISSMWGRSGASCEAAYSASKAAIIGLTKALSKELGPSGVRVNCIAPGVIDTKMMDEHSEETKAILAEETPLGRLGTGEDVARAAAFLLSDEASFITGQTLGVDGGYL
ncbi:MAG: SDR family oxidoreductase [Clostridiales bacterium]|nr:SDR family oxidoreductase [Clostridiales bacterium]